MKRLILLSTLAFLDPRSGIPVAIRDGAEEIQPNDNRTPAGRLEGTVLTVALEARSGQWSPEGARGPRFEIEAFAEEGKPAQTPGPLIRAPAGTEVRATVRNSLPRAMVLRGLNDRWAGTVDSVLLAPGERREVRFRASTPGTYYYWGRTRDDRAGLGAYEDGQLLGALVVDDSAAQQVDRLLVVQLWEERSDTLPPSRHTFLVNGLSWPHTERLTATVGDSMRLRVINASVASHPMHLHGFYFLVGARGSARRDTIYTVAQQRLAVTEFMTPGTTLALTWSPKRPGNWLFHCHNIVHIGAEQRMVPPPDGHRVENHALEAMAGLATGIVVHPRPGDRPETIVPRRSLRLFANARPRTFGDKPALGFVLQEGAQAPAPDSIRIPGTPIVLKRDEPVEITVLNRTPSPITVHWHGMELESYYDGVPGWSGAGTRVAPSIAPGDSFRVRMTPDRAGTFIYHTHNDEAQQLASGLYGPLIITGPGETWDVATNRLLLLGWGGPGPTAPPFLNGRADPAPVELEVDKTYRFRFINITPSGNQRIRLLSDSLPVEWRRFAKDGWEFPPQLAVAVPAVLRLGAGETYDFSLTPRAPTTLMLEITTTVFRRPPIVMQVPVVIRRP